MKKIEIKTEKFNLPELYSAIAKKKPVIGDLSNLKMFNETNYFQIKQFLDNGIPVGYGVIFLGYNSIETNDISIEDIAYWGDNNKAFVFIKEFTQELLASKDLPFKVEGIYYNPDDFIEEINIIFGRLGFKTKGRSR